ncbi:MAG: hypothetical protein ACFN4G_03195 [Mitsuokella sp.]
MDHMAWRVRFVVTGMLLILLFLPFSCAAAAEKADSSVRYENEELGISLALPTGFRLVKLEPAGAIYEREQDGVRILVHVEDWRSRGTLPPHFYRMVPSVYADKIKKEKQKRYKVLRAEPMEIQGMPVLRVKWFDPGPKVYREDYRWAMPGRMFLLRVDSKTKEGLTKRERKALMDSLSMQPIFTRHAVASEHVSYALPSSCYVFPEAKHDEEHAFLAMDENMLAGVAIPARRKAGYALPADLSDLTEEGKAETEVFLRKDLQDAAPQARNVQVDFGMTKNQVPYVRVSFDIGSEGDGGTDSESVSYFIQHNKAVLSFDYVYPKAKAELVRALVQKSVDSIVLE